MPNEPEQMSVNTTTTAVNSRILTRFRPGFVSSSTMRTPPSRLLVQASAPGASFQRSIASFSFSA